MLLLWGRGPRDVLLARTFGFCLGPLIVGDDRLSDCAVAFLAVDAAGILAGNTAHSEVPWVVSSASAIDWTRPNFGVGSLITNT